MRELKVVGLDADGKNIICEGGGSGEQFKLPVDDRLKAAVRGEAATPDQPALDIEVTNLLSPKEIQARIRSGASVEQVAAASGSDIARIRRFAHPVLLERSRAAELATAAHPLLADGPSGAHAPGDRLHRAGGTRPQPGQAGLGRLAQRGRPLDRAACVAGRPIRQPRALPLHSRRPRRNRDRDGRPGQRADRPGLQAPAAAAGAGGPPRVRRAHGDRRPGRPELPKPPKPRPPPPNSPRTAR